MKIRKALEAYYEKVKTPEGVESDVLYRIERERSRRWRKIVLAETIILSIFLAFFLYLYLSPAEYETMGAEESVRVKLVRDVSLRRLSKELSRLSLRIEGPYGEGEFYIKGDKEKVRSFLKKTDIFERLN